MGPIRGVPNGPRWTAGDGSRRQEREEYCHITVFGCDLVRPDLRAAFSFEETLASPFAPNICSSLPKLRDMGCKSAGEPLHHDAGREGHSPAIKPGRAAHLYRRRQSHGPFGST
jgi:hypothetical protein